MKVYFMPFCFCRRTILVPLFANPKKSEGEFHFYKKMAKSDIVFRCFFCSCCYRGSIHLLLVWGYRTFIIWRSWEWVVGKKLLENSFFLNPSLVGMLKAVPVKLYNLINSDISINLRSHHHSIREFLMSVSKSFISVWPCMWLALFLLR